MHVQCRAVTVTGSENENAVDSDCVALWSIRQSNPKTPGYVFKGWRAVFGADTSCCHSWLGVLCNNNSRVIELDLDSGNVSYALRISRVPASLGKLTALTALHLQSVAVGALPNVFASLPKLRSLHVLSSPISALPSSFWALSDLQILWISDVRAIGLTQLGGLCGSLKVFHCDHCGVVELPNTLGTCTKLVNIEVTDSSLRALPSSLSSTPVAYVKIDNTSITTLGPICGMQQLVWLTASSCKQLRSVDCSVPHAPPYSP